MTRENSFIQDQVENRLRDKKRTNDTHTKRNLAAKYRIEKESREKHDSTEDMKTLGNEMNQG